MSFRTRNEAKQAPLSSTSYTNSLQTSDRYVYRRYTKQPSNKRDKTYHTLRLRDLFVLPSCAYFRDGPTPASTKKTTADHTRRKVTLDAHTSISIERVVFGLSGVQRRTEPGDNGTCTQGTAGQLETRNVLDRFIHQGLSVSVKPLDLPLFPCKNSHSSLLSPAAETHAHTSRNTSKSTVPSNTPTPVCIRSFRPSLKPMVQKCCRGVSACPFTLMCRPLRYPALKKCLNFFWYFRLYHLQGEARHRRVGGYGHVWLQWSDHT